MVVPLNKIVRVQTIGAEVIHSFAIPSFGIRIDAVPGRLNETWFKANREASITASARACAERIMPSCRSRSGWSASRHSKSGWMPPTSGPNEVRRRGAGCADRGRGLKSINRPVVPAHRRGMTRLAEGQDVGRN